MEGGCDFSRIAANEVAVPKVFFAHVGRKRIQRRNVEIQVL